MDDAKTLKLLRTSASNLASKIKNIKKPLMAKRGVFSQPCSPRNTDDEAANLHEWNTFVKNHSTVHGSDGVSEGINTSKAGVFFVPTKGNGDEGSFWKQKKSQPVYEVEGNDAINSAKIGNMTFASVVNGGNQDTSRTKINFRTMVNTKHVEDVDFVLLVAAINVVQHKFANSLVGLFVTPPNRVAVE
ncbi:hypothetical protein Tco_1156050 [Tanacetum coccineum]